MTKLAPIKEFTKFGMRERRGLTVFNDVELELVRQAIIKDFVNSIEPVGYLCTKLPIDGLATIYQCEQDEVSVNPNGHLNIPLYDLSEWSNK